MFSMSIEVQIREPYRDQIRAERIRLAVRTVLQQQGAVGDVTVLITDDDEVTELNHRYMDKQGPTDVLSFPAIAEDEYFVMPPDEAPYLGDIVIALPYTVRQATARQTSLQAELDLLVIHGTLHLLGYDHDTPTGKAEMWALQEQILRTLSDEA